MLSGHREAPWLVGALLVGAPVTWSRGARTGGTSGDSVSGGGGSQAGRVTGSGRRDGLIATLAGIAVGNLADPDTIKASVAILTEELVAALHLLD